MENDLNKNEEILQSLTVKLKHYLTKLTEDLGAGVIDPLNLDEMRKITKAIRKYKAIACGRYEQIYKQENILQFRKFLSVEEKMIRVLTLKILRYNIEIFPQFAEKLKTKLFPLIICKLFEDHKYGSFEERLESFKLINTWLRFSETNFPLIFCQGVMALSRGQDEYFKKGSIEFLRNLAIKRPDQCSIVGGHKILIASLLDDSVLDISDHIFYTLLFVINNPEKRKYLSNLSDFYKIFSIFTKSDFSINQKDKEKDTQSAEEKNKLEVQLAIAKSIIEKFLRTWPGYSLIMGDYMAMGSIIESLNTDTSLTIKKNVLDMVQDLIDTEYLSCDNFSTLVSGDEFYVNKIFLAYILQGMHNNKLYNSLIKFIEKENNPLSEYGKKIALKFIILYSKLTNVDLQLPFLNEKLSKHEQIQKETKDLTMNPNLKVVENEVINMKVKIMNLLDQTYYHFNSKDISHIELKDLSDIVILAMNTVVNLQNIKKYNNQYSVEVSKRELYQIDDGSFQIILKNSKILESKDYNEWEWKRIDEILDIVENRKELIPDLYKQRFFKRLLYVFMPSKGLFVNLSWNSENFLYSGVGVKFFRILSNSVEGIRILDTSPEENYFSQNKTWYEDVHSCIESLIASTKLHRSAEERRKDPSPFSLKKVCKSMARQIFIFIGIISHSLLGEDYLDKKGFYSLMKKALLYSGRYDYIFTTLIDNLNFNTKNAVDLIQVILESGSKRIKRYVFEHIRCLFKFGREVLWSFKNFKFSIDHDVEVGKLVINILSSLFTEGRYIDDFLSAKPFILKISQTKKDILYLMMRNKEAYDSLSDFVETEIKSLDVKAIVETYAEELEANMNEIFNSDETNSEYYYMQIHLPKIEHQYENFSELFWIKQLPFNINIGIMDENGHACVEPLVLNTYLEFHDSNKLILYSRVHDEIKINIERNSIKFICMLGDQIIDSFCRMIYHANFLTFDQNDFKSISTFYKNNNKHEPYYRVEKDGVVINFTKDEKNKSREEYILYSIYFYIKIHPTKKISLKTPINLLTELPNTETGTKKLIETNAIPILFDYLNQTTCNQKLIKSALWILAKICTRETNGRLLNEQYEIIQKIYQYFITCEDYAMKGTICYVFCYIAQNKELRSVIESLNWDFFFNTDICYPSNMDLLYINKRSNYEDKKVIEDLEKVNKYITLTDKTSEIYANVTNLLNTITYKQSYEKLNDLFKTDSKAFMDAKLMIRIHALLSRYKYRQPLRRFILMLFENTFNNEDIVETSQRMLESLGSDLF